VISPLSVATGISHPLLYRQGLAEIRSTRPLTAGLPPMLAVFRIWGDALASSAQSGPGSPADRGQRGDVAHPRQSAQPQSILDHIDISSSSALQVWMTALEGGDDLQLRHVVAGHSQRFSYASS